MTVPCGHFTANGLAWLFCCRTFCRKSFFPRKFWREEFGHRTFYRKSFLPHNILPQDILPQVILQQVFLLQDSFALVILPRDSLPPVILLQEIKDINPKYVHWVSIINDLVCLINEVLYWQETFTVLWVFMYSWNKTIYICT